jgi:uncharacterized membrane protein
VDTIVFIAVLFSATIQATWNFFTKKSQGDRISILAVGWLLFAGFLVMTYPWTVSFSEFESVWLKYALATGVIHALYITLLGWGYSVGEISIIYPVSRGLGILWTSLASYLFGLHTFSLNGTIGVISVVAGVLLIGHKAMNTKTQQKSFFIAVAISMTVLLYSLTDSFAVKHVPLFFYITMLNLITAILVLPFLFKFSKPKLLNVVRHHKFESLLIGGAGTSAYLIILWAFKHASASYIVALREVSVVIASILGLIFLKEEISKRKLVGILLITLGAVLLKWS